MALPVAALVMTTPARMPDQQEIGAGDGGEVVPQVLGIGRHPAQRVGADDIDGEPFALELGRVTDQLDPAPMRRSSTTVGFGVGLGRCAVWALPLAAPASVRQTAQAVMAIEAVARRFEEFRMGVP